MDKVLFIASIVAWIFCFLVNLISIINIDIPFLSLQPPILAIGALIVLFPNIHAILLNPNLRPLRALTNPRTDVVDFWTRTYNSVPKWVLSMALLSIVYGVISMFIAGSTMKGEVAFRYGHYLLTGDRARATIITESEYHYQRAKETTIITGIFLGMYSLAAVLRYPSKDI